jgi:hypothetical protein
MRRKISWTDGRTEYPTPPSGSGGIKIAIKQNNVKDKQTKKSSDQTKNKLWLWLYQNKN